MIISNLANSVIRIHGMHKRKRAELVARNLEYMKESAKTQSQAPGMKNLFTPAYMETHVKVTDESLDVLAREIQKSMRFRLSEPVTRAILKMAAQDHVTLLKAFQYARLPYPSTWLEYIEDGIEFGFLLKESEDKKTVSFYMCVKETNEPMPFVRMSENHIYSMTEQGFSNHGIELRRQKKEKGLISNSPDVTLEDVKIVDEGLEKEMASTFNRVLSALIILNSRSKF